MSPKTLWTAADPGRDFMVKYHRRDHTIWKKAQTYWDIVKEDRVELSAQRLGYHPQHLRRMMRIWRGPLGKTAIHEILYDGDINQRLCDMADRSQLELLAGIAFIKNYPEITDHFIAASRRGVVVKLLFRPESLNSDLATRLITAGIQFRTLSTIHSKSMVADREALISSANLNFSSSQRNDEDGSYDCELHLVMGLRRKFLQRWSRAQPR